MPYPMAVQEDGTETDSEISSAGTISVNSNGYGTSHQNGLSSGWELGGNLPNTFVVLYGCSGYGELAIKMNSATSSVLHGGGPGAVTVNGGGGGVQVDNLALQLWDEEAETVLLAWAVVDAKLNKVCRSAACCLFAGFCLRKGMSYMGVVCLRGQSRAMVLLGRVREDFDFSSAGPSNITTLADYNGFRHRENGSFLGVCVGGEAVRSN